MDYPNICSSSNFLTVNYSAKVNIGDLLDFVERHKDNDVTKLRLKRFGDVGFDIEFAINQIEARQKTKTKLPSINANRGFIYPSPLSAEQATAEQVAKYKESIFAAKGYKKTVDLTGGLGVDSMCLASVSTSHTYIEMDSAYCNVAKHNFSTLGHNNITVINSTCEEFLSSTTDSFDAVYIDPARRGNDNRRIYAIADCEPNIIPLIPRVFELSPTLWIKVSPMFDITSAIKELKSVVRIYVISLKNECKELLFELNRDSVTDSPTVVCVDLDSAKGNAPIFEFNIADEAKLANLTHSLPLGYIYEPSASILKSGAFKSVCSVYNIDKLHINSHLYTSDTLIESFQGRKFAVKEVIEFKNSNIKLLKNSYPSANITTRNFPLSVSDLRKRLKVTDGGTTYIFATKVTGDNSVLIVCEKV